MASRYISSSPKRPASRLQAPQPRRAESESVLPPEISRRPVDRSGLRCNQRLQGRTKLSAAIHTACAGCLQGAAAAEPAKWHMETGPAQRRGAEGPVVGDLQRSGTQLPGRKGRRLESDPEGGCRAISPGARAGPCCPIQLLSNPLRGSLNLAPADIG